MELLIWGVSSLLLLAKSVKDSVPSTSTPSVCSRAKLRNTYMYINKIKSINVESRFVSQSQTQNVWPSLVLKCYKKHQRLSCYSWYLNTHIIQCGLWDRVVLNGPSILHLLEDLDYVSYWVVVTGHLYLEDTLVLHLEQSITEYQ